MRECDTLGFFWGSSGGQQVARGRWPGAGGQADRPGFREETGRYREETLPGAGLNALAGLAPEIGLNALAGVAPAKKFKKNAPRGRWPGRPPGSQELLLGSSGFFWVLLGSSGFFWVLLGFSGLFWALLGSSGLFWVLLLGSSGFFWVLLAPQAAWQLNRFGAELSRFRPV